VQTYRLREVAPVYLRPPPPCAPRPASTALPQTVASSPSAPLPPWQPVFVPPPPVPPLIAKPAQPESHRGLWIWLLVLVGIPFLISRLPKQLQPEGTMPPIVEVRRALPVVPRALPVTTPVSNPQGGQWRSIRFSDGSAMQIFDRGQLPSTAFLPPKGLFVGDSYVIGDHFWIWQQPTGAPASWIDP
jgi:hypothetical protein